MNNKIKNTNGENIDFAVVLKIFSVTDSIGHVSDNKRIAEFGELNHEIMLNSRS